MLQTLDDVVRRVVGGYDPDRVILFGSRAKGDFVDESDTDLLVVKSTAERPIARQRQLELLLHDRAIALDLWVYTPEELVSLYRVGSPFVQEIVETGRLLYMRKATAVWLRDVEDECEMAELLLAHGKRRGACLHSEQAVEKALKALVLERGERPPRTHDLFELANRVALLGWQVAVPADMLALLNSVYRGRYPSDEGLLPSGEPTPEEAQSAAMAARQVLATVRAATA
jgi:HEPN domain-containing protein/predicted nucleotidyltransferase